MYPLPIIHVVIFDLVSEMLETAIKVIGVDRVNGEEDMGKELVS